MSVQGVVLLELSFQILFALLHVPWCRDSQEGCVTLLWPAAEISDGLFMIMTTVLPQCMLGVYLSGTIRHWELEY